MAIDFGDLASRYLNARIDSASQAFTDPSAYLNNRLEQDFGNVQSRTTTIHQNSDGTSTVTQKQEIAPTDQAQTPSISSLNFAPPQAGGLGLQMPQQVQQPMFNVGGQTEVTEQPQTPQQVAQPQPMPQIQEAQLPQQLAQSAQQAMPQAAPEAAPQVQAAPQQVQLPQPGPGVQLAGPMVPGAVPNAPSSTPQPNQAPEQAAPAAAAAPMDAAQQAVIDAHNETDPDVRRQKLMAIAAQDPASASGKMAYRFIGEDYAKQQGYQKAMKDIENATPTQLSRYMTDKNKDGSWVRAILLQRLGFHKAAEEEIDKLGYGPKTSSAEIANGKQYTVVRNADGTVERAFTSDGSEVSQKELASISANMLPKQAHLLPSVHGAPVINAKGEVGTIMVDPRTQSSYVLVGNERRPTTGWTTMAQNYQNVYTAAGAQAQGKAAGEGFIPGVLPAAPGVAGGPAPAGGGAAPAQENAVQAATRLGLPITSGVRDQAKQQQLWDESVRAGRTGFTAQGNPIAKPGTSAHQNAMAVDAPNWTPAQKQIARQNGFVNPYPNDPDHWELRPSGAAAPSVAEQRKALEVNAAAEKERIQVAGKRSEGYNKYIDETIAPAGRDGDEISNNRKQQFALFSRPGVDASKIFGIANGAGQPAGDQRWTMLRDVILGKVSEPDDKLRERAAQLGLNREEQAVLSEYNNLNAAINSKTLKSTAGPGSISDAEQRMNRERNVDPASNTAIGAFNSMAQSQFNADLARYKNDWAASDANKSTNTSQLERDWRKEQQRLINDYIEIARQRMDYISKNGATASAVQKGYKDFPVPQYDPQTETWIKKKPLSSYNQ